MLIDPHRRVAARIGAEAATDGAVAAAEVTAGTGEDATAEATIKRLRKELGRTRHQLERTRSELHQTQRRLTLARSGVNPAAVRSYSGGGDSPSAPLLGQQGNDTETDSCCTIQ